MRAIQTAQWMQINFLVTAFTRTSAWLDLSPRPSYRLTKRWSSKSSFGIPANLEEMEVGHSFQYESAVVIEKVSSRPPIFVLRNILSKDNCNTIIKSASNFEPGRTLLSKEASPYRKACYVAWLPNDEDSVQRSVANKCHTILMPHRIFNAERGVESLQVVRYDQQGEYVLHHDSNKRLLTVLYYLNGIGETWFPLADSHNGPDPRNREEALQYCMGKVPLQSGVLVSCEGRGVQVQQGDAVAFFNFFADMTADWRSIHAGMPASSTKWIANHWYHYVPFGFADQI
ncbi:hypothetical protein ACA910_005103 [Epithemia clementina (nom. ined.)]